MAKRNVNDRNERVIQARKKKNVPSTYTTIDGTNRVIKLKDDPDILYIQQVTHDVEVPEAPTYSVQVGSRTIEYPLDVEVIKQTEDKLEQLRLRRVWVQYQQDLTTAYMDIAMRSSAAMYLEGTHPDEDMIEGDAKWQKKVRIGKWKIPDDLEEKWVLYLQTSLRDPDQKGLSAAIVRRAGGVSEEQIESASDMFLDNIPPDEGTGDLENLDADEEGVAGG